MNLCTAYYNDISRFCTLFRKDVARVTCEGEGLFLLSDVVYQNQFSDVTIGHDSILDIYKNPLFSYPFVCCLVSKYSICVVYTSNEITENERMQNMFLANAHVL